MATKSILKDITIKDKVTAQKFANAFEKMEGKTEKSIKISKSVKNLNRDQILRIFGK